MRKYGKVIVLEDDLLLSSMLIYMNEALIGIKTKKGFGISMVITNLYRAIQM